MSINREPERRPKNVFVGMGANLNNPKQQLETALQSIDNLPKTRVIKCSSFYGSKPMGPQDQDDFVNAVVMIDTELEALDLLDELQNIEKRQGRVRKEERWGPRTLDLDLLLYNNSTIDHPRLTVPHYGIKERNFVLLPLAELNIDLCLPDGTSVTQLLSKIDKQGIKRL